MSEYKISDEFVDKTDNRVTATSIDKRIMSGVPHYKLSVEPNLYNVQPRWLSEYGILIDFDPRGRTRGAKRKPKTSITALLRTIFG